MKQECHLGVVWLTWLGVPLLAVLFGISYGWPASVAILILSVFAQLIYIRIFPDISPWIGYGSVKDKKAFINQTEALPIKVTLYTSGVCPFCPIVRKRLRDMQVHIGFELEEIDITFKPNLIKEKGLRSVPVIEKDGNFLTGNATSAELLSFLTS